MTRRIAVVLGLAFSLCAAAISARVQAPPPGAGAQPQGGPWWRPRRAPRSTSHARRSRLRAARARDQQRPQARSLHPERRDGAAARRDLDGRLGVDGGHGKAHGAGRRRAAQSGWLRRRRRVDPFELAGAVSRASCTTSRPPSAGCARMRRSTTSIPIASRSWATAPAAGRRRWPRSPATRPRWRAPSARPACRARCRQRWRSIRRPTS